MTTRPALLWFCLLLIGCGGTEPRRPAPDAGPTAPDAGAADSGLEDGGTDDGSTPDDGGQPDERCGPEALLPFGAIGTLPSGRESHTAARLGERLLVFGGWSGMAATDTQDAAPLSDLSTWDRQPGALPFAREHHGLVLSPRGVCLVGGDDGMTVRAEVVCAERDAAGNLGSAWTPAPPLPAARTGHETVQVGDRVFVLGGVQQVQGASVDTVFWTTIEASGRTGDWQSTRSLPLALTFGAGASFGDFVYFAGGLDGRRGSASIVRARVEAEGGLGPWQVVAEMMDLRVGAAALVWAEHLWVLGGVGRTGEADTVWAWPIVSNGDLGALQLGPALPGPRFGHAVVAGPKGLLVIGGWQTTAEPPTDTVFEAACP